MKRMAMEYSLYEEVAKLRCNDLKFVAADFKKMRLNFKFPGQSARSQLCFDIDLNCVNINFRTREPGFYKETISNSWRYERQYYVLNVSSSNWKVKMCKII